MVGVELFVPVEEGLRWWSRWRGFLGEGRLCGRGEGENAGKGL